MKTVDSGIDKDSLKTQIYHGTIREVPDISDFSEIKRSLPAAFQLLSDVEENCIIFSDTGQRQYFENDSLRDVPVKVAGNCGSMPFIFYGDISSNNYAGYGTMLYQTKIKDLVYAIITVRRSHYNVSYIVAKRSQITELLEYFKNQNEEFDKTLLIDRPPLLPAGFLEDILKNSIDFLANYESFAKYGTRPARGLVLRGDPGNGKTMTCKWIQVLAKRQNLTVDTFTTADIESYYKDDALPELMTSANIIFFDDIDISFLSRRKGINSNSKMACSLLSAMDGIGDNKKGVARIFTTNEAVSDIDPAFLRPGRIDKVLTFVPPSANLRKQVITSYWHKEIVEGIDVDALVSGSEGNSFADLEEMKTLLVQGFVFDGVWNLPKALEDFKHRKDMKADIERAVKEEEEAAAAAGD
jgi:AAA+ superfamily predicted ATPase